MLVSLKEGFGNVWTQGRYVSLQNTALLTLTLEAKKKNEVPKTLVVAENLHFCAVLNTVLWGSHFTVPHPSMQGTPLVGPKDERNHTNFTWLKQ